MRAFVLSSYVLSVVEKLVVDDYVIVYLHSGAPRNSMPGIQWFHRFYRMIDRRYRHTHTHTHSKHILHCMYIYTVSFRLRKNLKSLFIVHPSFWVKTMLRLLRPFIRYCTIIINNCNIIQYNVPRSLILPPNSRKFYRKVSHISSLRDLEEHVKLDAMLIPEAVRR